MEGVRASMWTRGCVFVDVLFQSVKNSRTAPGMETGCGCHVRFATSSAVHMLVIVHATVPSPAAHARSVHASCSSVHATGKGGGAVPSKYVV